MSAVSQFLDNINVIARHVERSTRRKKRIQREHLVGAFHVVRVLANGLATVVPKALPVAALLNGLHQTVSVTDTRKTKHAPDSESDQ